MKKKEVTFGELKERCDKRFGKDVFIFNEDDYVNMSTPMPFTCSRCGTVITIPPTQFLNKSRCTFCFPRCTLYGSVESLIEKFVAKHGNKYDYSYIDKYCGVDHVYKIVCKEHGPFLQSGYCHAHGEGCPRCKAEKQKSLIYGVGVNDYKERVFVNGKAIPSYSCWEHMLKRCYEDISLERRPTYVGCSVCDEWLYFSNFKRWFDDPVNGYRDGYQLDKDLLVTGNKLYSPDTCCFLPNYLNSQIRNFGVKENGCPAGIYYREKTNKYHVSYSFNGKTKFVGSFGRLEDAVAAYKNEKETTLHDAAEDLYKKGIITLRVRDALINYKVTT